MRRSLIALAALALVLSACGTTAIETTTTETTIVEPTPIETTAPPITSAPVTSLVEAPAPIPTAPDPVDLAVRSITVGGMGSEYAEPVRCIIDIGVSSRRDTVGASGAAAASSAAALTDALLAAGVLPEDIQTSEFSVYPFHDDWPEISGYETHIGYRVAMPNVAEVGTALASAMNAGGDDVRAWGVRFEADPTGLIDTARAAAWADVTSRAEALAGLAGEPLGEMLDAHEKVLVSTTQGMYQGGEGDSATFDIPVSPGVSGVVVLLTVTFAIGE